MSDSENNNDINPEVKSEKKPISEATRAALAKARERAIEIRKENMALRAKEKAANLEIARMALETNKRRIDDLDRRAKREAEEDVEARIKAFGEVKQKIDNKASEERGANESDSEPEEVVEERVVKKKKKPKKPIRRRVVVVEESSEEEDDVQEEITSVTIPKTKTPDPMARMSERMFSL